ncbi:hypothetical protein DFJ73DRAFT_581300, partial [Zopfochytrium polystomum]
FAFFFFPRGSIFPVTWKPFISWPISPPLFTLATPSSPLGRRLPLSFQGTKREATQQQPPTQPASQPANHGHHSRRQLLLGVRNRSHQGRSRRSHRCRRGRRLSHQDLVGVVLGGDPSLANIPDRRQSHSRPPLWIQRGRRNGILPLLAAAHGHPLLVCPLARVPPNIAHRRRPADPHAPVQDHVNVGEGRLGCPAAAFGGDAWNQAPDNELVPRTPRQRDSRARLVICPRRSNNGTVHSCGPHYYI